MIINGRDCSVVIKTGDADFDVPYTAETLRDNYTALLENEPIENDNGRKIRREINGVCGVLVTPLNPDTVPLILPLAFGGEMPFDVIQDRGTGRKLYEGCITLSCELRILRGEDIKLKLDISGGTISADIGKTDILPRKGGNRFSGDFVNYEINGKGYDNIYGITLFYEKREGKISALHIKRALFAGNNIPEIIEDFRLTARTNGGEFAQFAVQVKRLVLVSDETEVDSADYVLGTLRYYIAGAVTFEHNRER